MKFRTSIYAIISLVIGATTLVAEDFQTGLIDLEVTDKRDDRPIKGYLWFPTHQTEGKIRAHGNAVWEPIRVIPNADPAKGKHPLVVLSHGMFGNARNQAWLAQGLSEKGYIVAAINHPGTSTFNRDPTQRRQLWERANDITRTIDYILDTSEFGDLVDQDRIYMAGHSMGGFTAILLAGGRYDSGKMDAFCAANPDELVCGIFAKWGVAKTPKDRAIISQDWSDDRIRAFAVFDLGGTQTFSPDSLANINRPLLVIGAPLDISGLDLDIESRALVAGLPKSNVRYLEPASLSHFDFLGVCTPQALDILKQEEPDDVFVCERGMEERRQEHAEIAAEVNAFFSGN